MSRLAFSRCSGGMEGRPPSAYIEAKVGESATSACPTMGLIRRIGWSAETNSSGVMPNNMALCHVTSPHMPHLTCSLGVFSRRPAVRGVTPRSYRSATEGPDADRSATGGHGPRPPASTEAAARHQHLLRVG